MVERFKSIDLYIINMACLFLIGTVNLINGIATGKGFLYFCGYSFIFYAVLLITYIFKIKSKYKWNALLYALMGLAVTYTGYEGNFSGAIFILFSIYIFNTNKSNLILSISTLLIITSKFALKSFTIGETVNMFIIYSLVFIIYFILIHPKNPSMIYNPKIDEENSQIIELIAAGKTNKEIADKVYLTQNAVTKRLKTMRDNFQVKSNCELIYILTKKGYFRHD